MGKAGLYPGTQTPSAVLARERDKEALLLAFRHAVRVAAVAALRAELLTFEHGSLFQQLKSEVNAVEAELVPGGLQASRKQRKTVKPGKRQSVFKRDNFTCQECGWKGSPKVALTPQHRRPGRHLTVDHIIPEAAGGGIEITNLRTLCSVCNAEKGREIPPEVAARLLEEADTANA